MSKAEKTRQFIIEKTAPIFNTKGYAGTSLTDMTEATGLTKGSIYGNFTNKDEVALAVFDFNLKKVQQIIRGEMGKRTSAREKLLAFVQIYGNYLKYPFPAGGCPILNTATEADDTHPELKKKVSEAIFSWKDLIITQIKKGIEAREFSDSLDPEQIALSIIAMIEGGIMIMKATGKVNYQRSVMKSVEKLINDIG